LSHLTLWPTDMASLAVSNTPPPILINVSSLSHFH
jgi:hypothetical protein